MFSSRVDWGAPPNALTVRIEARRRAGLALLDLTVSNPTAAGIPYPPDTLPALSDPAALRYEPTPAGLLDARAAVREYYASAHGVAVDASDVVLTASTSEAYAWLFKLLANPGDRVLVPHPSYPLFEYLAALDSVRLDPYALGYDGAWHLDRAALARALTPATRAVIVVNPNNPTGSFLTRDDLAWLLALCRDREIALVSDEVFADYAFAPDAARATTVAGQSTALAFSLSGLSKVCALPQLKLGWIALSGPPALRDAARTRLELVADTFLSVGTPVQLAARGLLAQRHAVQHAIRERTARNGEYLREAVAQAPALGCDVLHCEGGWSHVLRVPSVQSEEAWVLELLERDGVLVHPGYFFDFAREAYLVVSLLTPEHPYREGIARLIARVAERCRT